MFFLLKSFCYMSVFVCKRHFWWHHIWRHLHVTMLKCGAKFSNIFLERSIRIFCTKNYETASKFVKVMPKILLPLFFRTRCMWIFTVNLAAGPHFQSLYQIWCKYMQYWPTCGQKCDFRRHLGFCSISILPVKLATGPHFRSLCQICCDSIQNWPSYGRLTDFKMAAATILNLLLVSIFHFVVFG